MSLGSQPIALTIAGFDPSGGAGVLADARTFSAFELQPAAVITSITFQNAKQFFGASHQAPATVRAQIEALLADAEVACVKTGMLPTVEIVREVARLLRDTSLPKPVIDPVMISSSGARLMEEPATEALIKELLPLALLVTPNIPEAETLTGMKIESEADMRQAAIALRKLGAKAVLIKGGHLTEQKAEASKHEEPWIKTALDVLDNDGVVTVFRERHIPGALLHGSGCILSAAIAAGMGKGMTLEDAVARAKLFVFEKLRNTVDPNMNSLTT